MQEIVVCTSLDLLEVGLEQIMLVK